MTRISRIWIVCLFCGLNFIQRVHTQTTSAVTTTAETTTTESTTAETTTTTESTTAETTTTTEPTTAETTTTTESTTAVTTTTTESTTAETTTTESTTAETTTTTEPTTAVTTTTTESTTAVTTSAETTTTEPTTAGTTTAGTTAATPTAAGSTTIVVPTSAGTTAPSVAASSSVPTTASPPSTAPNTVTTAPPPAPQQGPVFDPFTTIPVLSEYTQAQQELAPVRCRPYNASLTCMCNVVSVAPSTVDRLFDVWGVNGDFRVFFVGTSTSGVLTYRRASSYFVEVGCTDNLGNTASPRTRLLEVDIRPNQAPYFVDPQTRRQITTFDVRKDLDVQAACLNTGCQVVVYDVTATDPENDHVSYTMTQSPDKGYFTIENGVIRPAVDLNVVTVDKVICTVTATDTHGNAMRPLTVTISLKNLNHRPVIENLPATIDVSEMVASPFILKTLTFSDPDTNQILDPQCSVQPAFDSYKFEYDKRTRQLKLKQDPARSGEVLLDYETTNQYLITCVVCDGALCSEGDVLTVNVVNVNEPPVFDARMYRCTMYESKPGVSACDLGLTVDDPDDDVITTVALLTGVNNSERFRYDDIHTRLSFNVDYDVDNNLMPTNVILTIYAMDSHRATGTAKIEINILDANDNTCTFGASQAAQFKIDQGTRPSTLGSFVATDADLTSPNKRVTFEVVSGLPTASLNYVTVFGNGEIKYVGLISETEHGKSYSLVVRCKDGGTPSLSATGTVQVSFFTTTSTTTSTTTTTTTTTTPTITTTTSPPEEDIWAKDGFVTLFAILMTILGIATLAGLWYLYSRFNPGSLNFNFQKQMKVQPKTPKYRTPKNPKDNFFRRQDQEYRSSPEYRDQAWRSGDHYESGIGYQGRPLSTGEVMFTGFNGRRALPPAPKYF